MIFTVVTILFVSYPSNSRPLFPTLTCPSCRSLFCHRCSLWMSPPSSKHQAGHLQSFVRSPPASALRVLILTLGSSFCIRRLLCSIYNHGPEIGGSCQIVESYPTSPSRFLWPIWAPLVEPKPTTTPEAGRGYPGGVRF